MDPELILTADGSHSLRSGRFSAAYHSIHGALDESRHIFIQAGLLPLLESSPSRVDILEMGLGTGLNAFLTLQLSAAYPEIAFHYTSFERYPISVECAKDLNYAELLEISPEVFLAIHRAESGNIISLLPNFHLQKRSEDFLSASPDRDYDLIYYDAFAPEQQPELWTEEAMRHCASWLHHGGRLVTYCAKGQFKRNLRAAGFRVVALPGPVGKREITRADLVDLA